MLFGGTVRYNLDPFNVFEDDALWKALEHVSQCIVSYINDIYYTIGSVEGSCSIS